MWRGEIQFGRGKAKLFLWEEKDFALPRLLFAGIWYPPRRRAREECAARKYGRILNYMLWYLSRLQDGLEICSLTIRS
ncbi:MAG: hypothetical protein COW88_02570 [Candidatus Lloydbacteria bacterium CG22_combo_CG10-13_8_21_14_all_47_15]|uniref:Uncharacterized protein n=1 Tax=Candidatus Lloydbacteria bacterium CG22_combo_CG10-13_8_21_14_all_47_15 TaxID=1974635 RepID=A0A2H0CTJ7_9BACT|nr:MAG: hypothetical protein COW88_02570 [Candidatus Lloydbacteria bacterium CG22_combo_CG10-13_8_21_14_all_47_15]